MDEIIKTFPSIFEVIINSKYHPCNCWFVKTTKELLKEVESYAKSTRIPEE